MEPPKRRIFAGEKLRALRGRLGLRQADFARRLEISVSYLSQIESGDRPLTELVLIALSRAFPAEWLDIDDQEESLLLVAAQAAVSDISVPGAIPSAEALRRCLKQHPQIVRRLVEMHAAYGRAQHQARSLDDHLVVGTPSGSQLPWEQTRDWFHNQNNYLDTLDRAAEELAVELGLGGREPAALLQKRLSEAHRVRIEISTNASDPMMRRFDEYRRVLTISGAAEPTSALFLMAHQLMRLEKHDLIATTIDAFGSGSDAARQLLSVGLANYAAGALLMPYEQFRRAAREMRHDIDRLRRRFMVSFEQVCHRLSTLQRPGAGGVPFFFCRVDMAGNITKRHSATRLQFAQTGGACPLWIVHEAVAIPDRIIVQRAETPDGVRYISMAKGLVKPSGSYDQAPRRYAVALGCEEMHAPSFVYSDDLPRTGSATPIGISCRICPRLECNQRAFPPAGADIRIDPNARAIVPYEF